MKSLTLIATALAALAAAATPGLAQSLQVTVVAGGSPASMSPGGTVALTATDIGQPVLATFTILNTGAAAASVTGVSVAGTSEMSLALSPGFPVGLGPNASTTFAVQYLPSTGNAVLAQVAIAFIADNQSGTFPLSVTGRSPRLAYSYSFVPNGALTELNAGDRIDFPGTNIGSSTTAVVNVLNRGSAAATLQSAAITGLSFQLFGAPGALQVPAGTQTSFSVIFSPQSTGGSQGLLLLGVSNNNVSFFLAGTGTTTNLTVTYTLADGNVQPLTDGTGIVFPGIDVNSTSTATIDIVNQGTGAGIVSAITLSGAGFRLSGSPLLPATIAAGQSVRFAIVFAPLQTGTSTATFRIDLGGRSIVASITGSTTTATFALSYTLPGGVANSLPDGGTIDFPAVDINGTATAAIDITNRGTGPGTVSSIVVTGKRVRATTVPALPASVAAGQSLRFGIVFAPTQADSYTGTFRFDLAGRTISGILSASTAAPNTTVAYIDPDTNSVLALRDGATLPFPNTPAATSSTLTMTVTNNGAGTGSIDSITLSTASPPAFQLLNLPPLPLSVPPSQQLRFAVRFSPPQQGAYSGTLVVTVNGRATTLNLQAQGSGPQFTYSYGPGTPTAAGGSIALGDTTVGQTASVSVMVSNTGTADGRVSTVAVTGAGFSLSDLPSLPFTVTAGGMQNFTLNFAPAQPGAVTGRLTIGSDTFAITGNGIGSRLTYSYTSAAQPAPVVEGGVVIFTPIEVGKNEKLQFAIQNTGTSPALIASINLAAPSTAFALEQLPALPFNLGPGATATFGLSFTPGTTGSLTATLRVNTTSFTLSGSGTQPASLPSYEFQAPAGAAQPAQQPSIGLSLASPYPIAIDGTLKLTFVSSVFTDDPAIQFVTGGRSVNFTIPANSTRALFNGNATLALQTGTTAGTILVTPSFAMRGGFDITPPTPDPLTITIARAAPQLLSASITSVTATGFTLVLNGYSTTRAMRQLDVQFTPKAGENFTSTRLTIDVTAAASAWYQSAASQGTGGSFVAAIPFALQNGSSTDDLVHRLQSLGITATNDAGISTAVTVTIP